MSRTSSLSLSRAGALVSLSAGLASVAAAACSVTAPVTVVHIAPGGSPDTLDGDTVKLRRGAQEAYVGMPRGYHVVRSAEDWSKAWGGSPSAPLPPTVDTSRSMLLVGVAEDGNAVALRVERVTETGNALNVFVRETLAGDGCSAKIDGQERTPVDAVTTARIDKPLRVYVSRARAESCGDAPAATVRCRVGETAAWSEDLRAQPGDTVECEISAEQRGSFAIVDRVVSIAELPGGSAAKLAYTSGSIRGKIALDVFGTYTVRAEARDESGRRGESIAKIEALPPKTKDALVQLVWTNFDLMDDPETFPRVKLRASEVGAGGRACSVEAPRPEMCSVKTLSAYTHMRLNASEKKVALDVTYVDERVEKGPLVCVQVYFDGTRTVDTCDRLYRAAEDRWTVGTLEMATGKLEAPATPAPAPAEATSPGPRDAN